MAELGRELINPLALADVRFVTHYGLKLDIAMSPKSARKRHWSAGTSAAERRAYLRPESASWQAYMTAP
jgi:hypothetical protein